jgi:3-oxoacyl-[acyl-carrier protein] reductase
MATTSDGLDGRVAIVTGAAAGIGRAIAAELVVRGAAVAIIDRDAAAGERTAATLAEAGEAAFFEADVADAESVQAAVACAARAYERIDIAVNNAGILDGFLPVLQTDEALWDRVLDVNLKGVFLVTKAALPHMISGGGGVFVNMASAPAWSAASAESPTQPPSTRSSGSPGSWSWTTATKAFAPTRSAPARSTPSCHGRS